MEGLRIEGTPIIDSLGKKGLLYIYGPNCPWCARQKPIIEEIKARGSVPVVEVDASKNPELVGGLRVSGTPTMVLVEGGVIKRYLVGFQGRENLFRVVEG